MNELRAEHSPQTPKDTEENTVTPTSEIIHKPRNGAKNATADFTTENPITQTRSTTNDSENVVDERENN